MSESVCTICGDTTHTRQGCVHRLLSTVYDQEQWSPLEGDVIPLSAKTSSALRLTAEGVADLLGVARSTISSYASRGQMPKPTPCPCCGHPTWDAAEIRTWASSRPGRIGRPKK